MGNFRSDSGGGFGGRSSGRFGERSGGGRDFGGRSGGRDRFGGRDSGRFERRSVQMHDVTCDKCGKECQVPFRPTGNKPVLCSDCFKKNDGSSSNSDFGSRSQGQSSSGMSLQQFSQINAKLDKIIEFLESLEIEGDMEDEDDEDEDENDKEDLEADETQDDEEDLEEDEDGEEVKKI